MRVVIHTGNLIERDWVLKVRTNFIIVNHAQLITTSWNGAHPLLFFSKDERSVDQSPFPSDGARSAASTCETKIGHMQTLLSNSEHPSRRAMSRPHQGATRDALMPAHDGFGRDMWDYLCTYGAEKQRSVSMKVFREQFAAHDTSAAKVRANVIVSLRRLSHIALKGCNPCRFMIRSALWAPCQAITEIAICRAGATCGCAPLSPASAKVRSASSR